MASIITTKTGPRMIAWYGADGRRQFVRLGPVSMKQAESVKGYIEDLVACKFTGTSPKNTTAEWVGSMPDAIRRRVECSGLIGPQQRADVPTLGEWLDRYIDGRKDVKPRTHLNYDQARKAMIGFFGKDKPLDQITHGDCEDFRVWMRTEKQLAEGTTRRQTKRCKQFLAAAIKRKLITDNPFDGIKCSNYSEDRFYFVSQAEAGAVLDACPDAEWRLIFALARYGGLRVPSELLPLEWGDIHWDKQRLTVRSPKTEHHDGKGSRLVPIFPELQRYLRDAFEQAEPGQRYVITRYRDINQNLRTQFTRIIERAGLKPWPKMFQNLRSTRETELAEKFPIHVVTAWLGNSLDIAHKHYLQITPEHFERAVAGAEEKAHRNAQRATPKAHRNAHPQAAASCRTISQNKNDGGRNYISSAALCDRLRNSAGRCVNTGPLKTTPKGTRTPVSRMRT